MGILSQKDNFVVDCLSAAISIRVGQIGINGVEESEVVIVLKRVHSITEEMEEAFQESWLGEEKMGLYEEKLMDPC